MSERDAKELLEISVEWDAKCITICQERPGCGYVLSPTQTSALVQYAKQYVADLAASEAKYEKLRAALEFYANKNNWTEDDWCVMSIINPPDYGDPGKTAREALEADK